MSLYMISRKISVTKITIYKIKISIFSFLNVTYVTKRTIFKWTLV